jgi:hypothetical protein
MNFACKGPSVQAQIKLILFAPCIQRLGWLRLGLGVPPSTGSGGPAIEKPSVSNKEQAEVFRENMSNFGEVVSKVV